MKADLMAVDLSRLRGAYLDDDADLLGTVMARGLGLDVLMTIVGGVERYRRGTCDQRRKQAAELAARTAAASRSAGEDASSAATEIAEALRNHYAGHA